MSAVIHRKTFDNGNSTPEEYHSKYAFPLGARCAGCNADKGLLLRAFTYVPLDEMKKRDPMFDALIAVKPEAALKLIVPLKGGDGKPYPHVRVSTTYACKRCVPELEKALAKSPSWAVVDISRGPGPSKIVSGP
jgi:hypothetical protein